MTKNGRINRKFKQKNYQQCCESSIIIIIQSIEQYLICY